MTDGVDDEPTQGRDQTGRPRYHAASKTDKATILDELCALTGWHRDHARKALRSALKPSPVAPHRKKRDPVYDTEVIMALRKVWALLDAPAGKRLAPFLPQIVERLIACGELSLSEQTRATNWCGYPRPPSIAAWPPSGLAGRPGAGR